MDTRRSFVKKAAALTGAAGLFSALPTSIQKALQIDPAFGSTYLDAEHVVILMQENRSFDHSYGALNGVRGFNDPRAMRKANGDSVWVQKNAKGEAYTPFRLNIKDTNATFLGSLPHSWSDQVDARNKGQHDKWLIAKATGYKGMEQAPLSLGYYDRRDIPFYYALADAFTICDQNFSSSLTGTTPNRLYLWTGTIRETPSPSSKANVVNSDVTYSKEASWKTFPERLQDNAIPWKIYQNEISLATGLSSEEDDWLANFTDNPIEWFEQYKVRFSKNHFLYLEKMEQQLPGEIDALENEITGLQEGTNEMMKAKQQLRNKLALLQQAKDRHRWSPENFDQLTAYQKELHQRAFSINAGDTNYRTVDDFTYTDEGVQREMKVPKGDVLYQFRKDVEAGELPTVSWVVGPSNFSDHPGSPWYGAWYVSEVMDILTKNPDVWKKTIFILCYDENDGYYDHVPPFVPPHPHRANTGKVSEGIDITTEYVLLKDDLKARDNRYARESPIGLGYRVPLVIASPWSRGGAVCSQVFDHTSILQFLEVFLSHKTGKAIKEENISAWRRTVCGDLTSVFKPYYGEKMPLPDFLEKEKVYASIHQAQFRQNPEGFKPLAKEEIALVNEGKASPAVMPVQEKGMRSSMALPYELYTTISVDDTNKALQLSLTAGNQFFQQRSAGSPFTVYAKKGDSLHIRHYAVKPGDTLTDAFAFDFFDKDKYHIWIDGPNGFYREYKGDTQEAGVEIKAIYKINKQQQPTGEIVLQISNNFLPKKAITLLIEDNAYGQKTVTKKIGPATTASLVVSTQKSFGWYDFTVRIQDSGIAQSYAGRVEIGKNAKTDPVINK